MGWRIFQLYVKLAFLNGYLEKDVYAEQITGFAIKREEKKVLLRIWCFMNEVST